MGRFSPCSSRGRICAADASSARPMKKVNKSAVLARLSGGPAGQHVPVGRHRRQRCCPIPGIGCLRAGHRENQARGRPGCSRKSCRSRGIRRSGARAAAGLCPQRTRSCGTGIIFADAETATMEELTSSFQRLPILGALARPVAAASSARAQSQYIGLAHLAGGQQGTTFLIRLGGQGPCPGFLKGWLSAGKGSPQFGSSITTG